VESREKVGAGDMVMDNIKLIHAACCFENSGKWRGILFFLCSSSIDRMKSIADPYDFFLKK
jgi:hypothetical protein